MPMFCAAVAEAGLVLQLHGQLAGLRVPGPRLGQTARLSFGQAEAVVGPHHRLRSPASLKRRSACW